MGVKCAVAGEYRVCGAARHPSYADKRVIFNTLNEKLLNETMTKDENRVFLKIAEEEAQLRNKRVKYMIELSQLRGISFQKLMNELGFSCELDKRYLMFCKAAHVPHTFGIRFCLGE